jgi:AAA15 family ATPase/GTPase
MIPSIYIKNYRNLEELSIESFGHVNLIAGKNNTGKSSLLEAVSIIIKNGDLNWIKKILDGRDEYLSSGDEYSIVKNNIKSYSSIFSGRKFSVKNEDNIRIQKSISELGEQYIEIGFDFFPRGEMTTQFPFKYQKLKRENDLNTLISEEIELSIINKYGKMIFPMDEEKPQKRNYIKEVDVSDKLQYIKMLTDEKDYAGVLWDNITLTYKEESVLQALRIIEGNIERIALVKSNILDHKRDVVVKLQRNENLIPLSSMGDGINRVFIIILSMVNCENGYLLVDELENGLHYTVQEQLWKVIFDLSYKLNIQVFSTTHSSDCIRSFAKVINMEEKYKDSKLIRLDLVKGRIGRTEYDAEELKIAEEQDIETR